MVLGELVLDPEEQSKVLLAQQGEALLSQRRSSAARLVDRARQFTTPHFESDSSGSSIAEMGEGPNGSVQF